MNTHIPVKPQPWLVYFFDCLFAGISVAAFVFLLSTSFLSTFYYQNGPLFMSLYLALLTGSIALSAYWYIRQKRNLNNWPKLHLYLRAILRYWLAYVVSVYGFAKIFKTQFDTMYYRNDIPVGALSGFELTWNYFGYSYNLAVILATLQIGGGVLLLFRRTTLLGCCILLPVMVNIVLINAFYDIANGAFVISVLITAGLTYLVLLRWSELKKLFFKTGDHHQNSNKPAINLLVKIIVITAAFFTIYQYIMYRETVDFTGKWKVIQQKVNGTYYSKNDWLTNDKAWQYVYIENNNWLMLSPNPYVYETGRATRATYSYNTTSKKLNIVFQSNGMPVDTVEAAITRTGTETMIWHMIYGRDTMTINMTRVPPQK